MTTQLNLQITDHSSPLPNVRLTIQGGQPVMADSNGFASLVADGLYQADPNGAYVTITIAPPGKKALVTELPVKPDGVVSLRADYSSMLEQIEQSELAARSGAPARTLRHYDRSSWLKFFSVVGPVVGLLVALGVGLWLYMQNQSEFNAHFNTLRATGPAILGGLWTFVIVTLMINSLDALTRGERGMMEDLWAPIVMIVVAVGSKPYIADRLEFIRANMAAAPLETIFYEGFKVGGLVFFFVGAGAIAMIRAVVWQRMEKRLDTSPLIAALVIIGAFAYYHVFGLNLTWPWWAAIVTVLVLALAWEMFKKPWPAGIGILIGVITAFIGNRTSTLVIFATTALVVFGVGVYYFVQALDKNPQTPEFRKLMEKIPLQVIEFGWLVAFVVSAALARFGGVPTP